MIEVLQNDLLPDGMRRVKIISDKPVTDAFMMSFVATPALEFAKARTYDTAALSLFYGEVEFPLRGPVDIASSDWKKFRRLIGWKIMPGERMSEAIADATLYYLQLFARFPSYAFVRKLPAAVDDCLDIDGVMLVQCEWAFAGCLLVGG